jgi:hypothetical protein
MLNESVQKFEKELDQILNEDIASVITSPVKFVKIKNNAKKYQKALVQQSLNDIDLAKKKAASKEAGKPTDVLTAANKAKNASLRDLATGISDRMDDLATTDILKNVSSLAKTKAKVAAAETALKASDAEESKELKIKIKKLNAKAAEATKAIKDYESSEKKKDDATPANTEVKSDFDKGKAIKPETKTTTETPEDSDTKIIKDTPKQIAAKSEIRQKITKQENDIEKLKGEINIAEDDVPQLKSDLEKVKGTDKEAAASEELAFQVNMIKKYKEDLNKKNEVLKGLKDELNKI